MKPKFNPTLEQIAAATANIRRSWTDADYVARATVNHGNTGNVVCDLARARRLRKWEVPYCKAPVGLHAEEIR